MTTEAPTTGSTTSTTEPSTSAEQAARLLTEPLPADVRIAMIQQVLNETGQALAVLQTMADLLAGQQRGEALSAVAGSRQPGVVPAEGRPGVEQGVGQGEAAAASEAPDQAEVEARKQFNQARLADIWRHRDKNHDLAHLLLSMLDEAGAPHEVPREEYLRLTREAGYANPGAVTRVGYVIRRGPSESQSGEDICIVTDKGMKELRDYGFRVA